MTGGCVVEIKGTVRAEEEEIIELVSPRRFISRTVWCDGSWGVCPLILRKPRRRGGEGDAEMHHPMRSLRLRIREEVG